MSANEEFDRLPQYLKTSWCLRQDPEDFGRILEDLKGWSVTSISSAYLQFRLEAHRQKEQDCVAAGKLLQSLSSASAAEVIKLLEASVNLDEDIQIIATSLNSATFSQILRDPRLPYPILRAFLALPSPFWVSEKRPVDVDEAILSNEKYIQSRGTEQNKDGKFLITLESLSQILGVSPDHQGPLIITRRDPPKGGFETLDAKRKRSIQIQPTDHAFAETFQRITKNILKGLDWNHIFVAGGMVLTTLLHIDPSKDHDKDVQDCDIDMYLYGLEPEEANRKIEEIYDVWSANLPDSNTQKLVVKNARSITFLAGYPNRRVQIIFKMLTSPIQALLNFDLDACALGFDGKRVLMLPRCSRALEVGYSTFTMNLGDRRSTLEARFFKYADRGFGLRILPSYTRSLEDKVFQKARHVFGVDLTSQELCIDPDRYVLRDRPKEPGLKTLKRIAYLGRDFVHRYCFGEAYSLHPEVGASNADDTSDSFSREATVATNQRVGTWEQFGNFDMISPMSTDRLLADWRGLCGFELFMRRCEAWQLEARGITQ
ncbi:hypothetical protein MMC12_002289 [Toensbergia leucococca]|nr:hypothetical protein [Toensbergia leucococca]